MYGTNLISRAQSIIRAAETLSRHEGDKDTINQIAFFLGRATLLSVFFMFAANRKPIPTQGDLDFLFQKAHEEKVELYLSDYIKEHSEMLTLWNYRFDGILDYRVNPAKVERALPQVREYIENLKQKVYIPTDENIDPVTSQRIPETRSGEISITQEIARLRKAAGLDKSGRYDDATNMRDSIMNINGDM